MQRDPRMQSRRLTQLWFVMCVKNCGTAGGKTVLAWRLLLGLPASGTVEAFDWCSPHTMNGVVPSMRRFSRVDPEEAVMQRSTRRKLDMIQRVYALSQQHKADIHGYVESMRLLGEKLARAELLATQQETGDMASGTSKARKDELEETIRSEHVEHLARIARVVLPDDPELRRLFKVPRKGLNRQEFVAKLRAMLAEAASRRELFIAEGMPETFVEDLEGLLARYLEAVAQKGLGEATRVGAVAELPEVTSECMALVRRLDGINRKRWQKSPELLAAWLSAKDIGWPHPKPEAAPGDPGSGESAA